MKKRVLITGASSGIGYELAKIFASSGYDLVLVARSRDKLEKFSSEIKSLYNVDVFVIIKDLSDFNSAQEIYNELKEKALKVDILVNNAGFGDHGDFVNSSLKKQEEMIRVNVNSLVSLTRLFLPEMLEQNFGAVMNIASMAAFQPGPYMAVYYATKAFVLSFSDALSYELKGTGVWVTTICPGPTKTNFESTAKATKLFKSFKIANAYDVALFSYHSLMKKKGVAVPGFKNKLLTILQKLCPRFLTKKIVAGVQR